MIGSSPRRALVIGAGPAAVDMHLPALSRLRDEGLLSLDIVCDIQQARALAAQRAFRFSAHARDAVAALSRPEIHVVYVFGSAQLHHEYGLLALRHGKHLFVEKPAAPSFLQACELEDLARQNGLIAVAGHNRRFLESLAAVRGHAGAVRWQYVEAVFHKAELGRPVSFGAATWLGANGIHALDALVFMMGGMPESLLAQTGGVHGASPTRFSALLRWRDGAQGAFLCDNTAGLRREHYHFHGAGISCSVDDRGLTIATHGRASAVHLPSPDNGIAAEHRAFLDAIHSGVQPRHSIAAIAPSLHLAELIEAGHCGRVQLPARSVVTQTSQSVPAPAVLVGAAANLQPQLARLLHYRLIPLEAIESSSEQRPEIVAAILGHGAPPLPPDLLARLPNLRVIGIVGLSLQAHAPEALLSRGIAVVNASAAYAESVAEFALGLAILGRRRAFLSHEVMRQGGWGVRLEGTRDRLRQLAHHVRPLARMTGLEGAWLRFKTLASPVLRTPATQLAECRELAGATVGLVGWGANACAFAARLTQARARVLVYSEHATDAEIQQHRAVAASLDEVLAADVISLHRGLTHTTRHSLGSRELARLRPGVTLINVARGALIEPAALLARLQQGDIFACLDAYDEEPLPPSHPLRSLPNVFLTSHIAGGSADMRLNAAEEVATKVLAHLAGNAATAIPANRLRTMT